MQGILEQARAEDFDVGESLQTPALLAERYRYISCIGEGSMGKTYLAFDQNSGRKVAVKALKIRSIDAWKSYELFERESRVLRKLAIEGVPKFHDFIEDLKGDDPQSYIVQEYIDAPSLQKLIDEARQFSEAECVGIGIELLGILRELHSLHPPVIHRDIKPSNILLRETNDRQKPYACYLIDFGSVANPQLRGEGSTVAGTFGYMPPEQIAGDCQRSSDLYAFGATFLHLLTGVAPYTMPSEVFKLQYEAYLAPKTSKGLRNLLAELLEPDVKKRISDTEIALEWLKAIEKKKPFDYEKIAEKESKALAQPNDELQSFWEPLSYRAKLGLCKNPDKKQLFKIELLNASKFSLILLALLVARLGIVIPFAIAIYIIIICAVRAMQRRANGYLHSKRGVLMAKNKLCLAKIAVIEREDDRSVIKYNYVVDAKTHFGYKRVLGEYKQGEKFVVAYNIEKPEEHCVVWALSDYTLEFRSN
ncbi:MAG: serine/threonine-protein kinase [Bradymonadales bacterium]|jgi:serine/threonine protein kinase